MANPDSHGNYLFLLGGLTILLISYPMFLMHADIFGVVSLHIAISITLILSVWSLVGKKKSFVFGIMLAGLSILVNLIEFQFEHRLIMLARIAIQFLFFSLTLWIAVEHVMFGDRIDLNRIVGTICIYLLIGIIWSIAYSVLNMVYPGSFRGLDSSAIDRQNSELIYFSFITLTTLGYGDIIPIKPVARTLAYFEAIAGQFYLAVMVAGLVGARIARNTSAKTTEPDTTERDSVQHRPD